jgi:DNA adenine methylase
VAGRPVGEEGAGQPAGDAELDAVADPRAGPPVALQTEGGEGDGQAADAGRWAAPKTQPLKWHGGKDGLARKIIALMPPHLHYVEPYAGGLAVLLAKNPQGISEVVNDINKDLMNFWRVLQGEETFKRFRRVVEAVPFAEPGWLEAKEGLQRSPGADPVQRAVWFFVFNRQSLAGRMEHFAPLSRNRTRRGMNEQASAWLGAVEGLPAVHARLRRVVILDKPALEVIKGQDGPETLNYLDPSYLHETRATPDVYAHEMSDADHRELLETLAGIQGKFLLSGYPSAMYENFAAQHRWRSHPFDRANQAAGGKTKKRMTEVVWCNF